MLRCCAALLLLLGASSLASARDWYVNNLTGDDTKDGQSEQTLSVQNGPVRTINRALRGAQKMDRIILANTGEPYRENFTLLGRLGGYAEAPFTIIGNGAVLDGSQPVPSDEWEFAYGEVYRFRPQRMPYQVLFLDGKPLPRGGSLDANGQRAPLAPMEWNYVDGYIYFRPEARRMPQQYNLTMAAQTVAITLYQVQWVEIHDLVIQGYQLDGVNAHDSAFHVRLSGITSQTNGRSGISIGGASQVELQNCQASENGVAQLRTEGYSHTKIRDSQFADGAAPGVLRLEHSQVSEVEPAP